MQVFSQNFTFIFSKNENSHSLLFPFLAIFSLTKVIIYDNFLLDLFFEGAAFFRQIEGTMKDTKNRLAPRYEVVEQLKDARKSQNVIQEVLAERVGTKKSNISRFESGKYNPSLDFLIKVADSLGKQIHIKIS